MQLLGLPVNVRQGDAQQRLQLEHAALFWLSTPEQEAGLEAGVLVREDRVCQLLLQPSQAVLPQGDGGGAGTTEQSGPQIDDLAPVSARALITMGQAERRAHLKSKGLKLGDRLRIEAEICTLVAHQSSQRRDGDRDARWREVEA